VSEAFRSRLLDAFAWVDGHADVWRFFSDASLLREIAARLADPFRDQGVTKVAGIEARGFILGTAVALDLDAGLVAIRKGGSLFPGEKLEREASRDYQGTAHTLRIQRASLSLADRVLLVDDWFETGSQALAAKELIERCSARLAGAAVIVDQLPAEIRPKLGDLHSLLRADELPPI
jgi:adenine phosphoribosyltransferase